MKKKERKVEEGLVLVTYEPGFTITRKSALQLADIIRSDGKEYDRTEFLVNGKKIVERNEETELAKKYEKTQFSDLGVRLIINQRVVIFLVSIAEKDVIICSSPGNESIGKETLKDAIGQVKKEKKAA